MKLFTDILIGVSIALGIGFLIYVMAIKPTLDVSYACYEYSTELGQSRFVEVTNCEQKEFDYQCEEGTYKYCHEGGF